MSLKLIEMEIRRFLSSGNPEVLCITGKWGVGKTYAWKKYLAEAEQCGTLSQEKYSYVTLFGINSLDDLRYSIFENTVTGKHVLTGPTIGTFGELFGKGSDLSRKLRPILDAGLALINRKGVGDALYKASFLTVNKQLICIDDLERAGRSLGVRDVLGLVSSLKEERKCKVVLLLNEEAMDQDKRTEFSQQLEKVVDIRLTFDLTAEEAAEIALPDGSPIAIFLQPRIVELGITNIRVIKKIERLATHLVELLNGFHSATLEQAIATLVLGEWSLYQPEEAPPLSFIRNYNAISNTMRASRGELDERAAKWHKTLENYRYHSTDDLDAVILDALPLGYFNAAKLQEIATNMQEKIRLSSRDNLFNKAWEELFHGSLATDDSEFLDVLYKGMLENINGISLLNMNSSIRMLREHNRPTQANDIIDKYLEANAHKPLEFFSLRTHHFLSDEEIDEVLHDKFSNRHETYVDKRDPLEVLQSIGERRSWGIADVSLMAKQSPEKFESMFEALRGESLRSSVESILSMGRSKDSMAAPILASATEALRRIARKSPIRALKVRRFGVTLETATEGADAGEPESHLSS